MADIPQKVKKQINRGDNDLQDLTGRIQNQVNELVERVTGVREARRQALSTGLAIGVIIGLLVGIAIGIALDEQRNHSRLDV